MNRFLLVFLVLGALGIAAQSTRPPMLERDARVRQDVTETPHLTATASPRTLVAAPGARVSLFIDIVPKPKMHVYAPHQKDYIPVAITLDPGRAFRAFPPVFPKPEKYFFAPLKETQLVYSKPFRIVQNVTLAAATALREAGYAPASAVTITGKLRYQACDDTICYFPKDLPVSWTVKVKTEPMQ